MRLLQDEETKMAHCAYVQVGAENGVLGLAHALGERVEPPAGKCRTYNACRHTAEKPTAIDPR